MVHACAPVASLVAPAPSRIDRRRQDFGSLWLRSARQASASARGVAIQASAAPKAGSICL